MTYQSYINLVNQAVHASYEYYVLSSTSMSDADFDSLVAQIEAYEQQHPDDILPDSPTQRVGSDLSGNGRRTIRHRSPMLSLQKAKTIAKVEKWHKKTAPLCPNTGNVLLSWKYDGISCSLVYFNGKLIEASTRGDGLVGQDILDKVKLIPSVPHTLKPNQEGQQALDIYHYKVEKSGRIEVRGEIVCPKDHLSLLRNRYKDCRTAAASLCNMDYADPDCEMLSFCVWGVDCPAWMVYNHNESASRYQMGMMGFEKVEYQCSGIDFPDQIGRLLEQYAQQRESLPFPTDGVVIAIDNKREAKALGSTAHHPHGSIAFKFSAQKAVTTCTRIEVTIGKSGRRTPVAYFTPVIILGRETSKATLYSETHAAKLGITPGSTIEVGLSNDITPKVYRVISPAKNHKESDAATVLDGFPVEDKSTVSNGFPSDFKTDDSVLYDSVAETEDVSIVYPEYTDEEIHARMLVATGQTSLDYDTVLANLLKEKAAAANPPVLGDSAVENEAIVPDGSPSGASKGSVLGGSPAENETSSPAARIALAALSILGIIVLFPLVMALTAFGIPIVNGAFK